METAYIEVSVKTNSIGRREAVNYKWMGKSPYTRVSYDMMRDLAPVDRFSEQIQVGPYKLLLVEQQYYWESALYVRDDKFGALRVALYKSTRLLDLAYRRLIITLAVWRLAEYREATMPTWRDIKALKWFTKR